MDFGTVLLLIVLIVLPVAAVLFAGSSGLLEQLGKDGLSIEERRPAPVPPTQGEAGRRERELEIRQLLQARRDRQAARGEALLDIEAEVSRLVELSEQGPAEEGGDSALREEVRQLVLARNGRRAARGEPSLDVEAEIDRQLRDIGA